MSLITPLNECPKGLLHDFMPLSDRLREKWEACRQCGKRIRWLKDSRGRVDNAKYLEAHRRDFLQRTGSTAKLFYAIYQPENYEAHRDEWVIKI